MTSTPDDTTGGRDTTSASDTADQRDELETADAPIPRPTSGEVPGDTDGSDDAPVDNPSGG